MKITESPVKGKFRSRGEQEDRGGAEARSGRVPAGTSFTAKLVDFPACGGAVGRREA